MILVLHANTPAKAQSLLHNLKQVAKVMGHKTEFMCFNYQMAVFEIIRLLHIPQKQYLIN